MKYPILLLSALLSLVSSLHSATLVNDFSGGVSGYAFTENPSSDTNYYTSAATQSATATALPGQVDIGFYTVNFSDAQPINIGQFGRVTAFQGSFGSYDPDLGSYVGGNLFSLDNITGFLLSLRREHLNTADKINLYILSDQDREYYFPVELSLLPASIFMDVAIDLTQYAIPAGMGAVEIAIKGDATNAAPSTYNFSIDSLRAVPEPSSGLLLISGFGAFALLRRRSR